MLVFFGGETDRQAKRQKLYIPDPSLLRHKIQSVVKTSDCVVNLLPHNPDPKIEAF